MKGLEPLNNQEVRCLPEALQEEMFGQDDRFLFGRLGVHGDGTCFFHSLCAALNIDDYLHRGHREQQQIGHDYRCDFTKYVTQERWDKFKRKRDVQDSLSLEEVKEHFCNNKHWADETMIKFVSDTLKLNIIFIDTNKYKVYCGVRGHKHEPLVVVLWLDHSHFEPMFRILNEELDKQALQVQFKFDMLKDKDVIDTLMSTYNMQCNA